MKCKIKILTVLLFSVIISASCIFMGPSLKGNGNVVEETRKVGEFSEIKVSRGMNVYISQGDETKVVVIADDNLLDAIKTQIDGNSLKVTVNRNIRNATSKKVFVTTPNISMIKSTAGSNVFSETVIRSQNLDLSGSAGSNMKLDVNSKDLTVSVSAGSNIKLEGKTKLFSGQASSGSNLKAKDLVSDNCEVKVSSGANIWITATDNLNAHASSGGNIFYYGKPETTDIEKSSGGNIVKN